MSLSSSLSRLRRLGSDPDLADQVVKLTHDVRKIARSLSREAKPLLEDAGHSASELAHEISDRIGPIAHRLGVQAQSAGRMVRNDPVPAVVAIGTVALIATLLLARR